MFLDMLEVLSSFKVLLFNGFLEGLFENENGNINITIINNKRNDHQLRLNYTNRVRRLGKDKVKGIKGEMNAFKDKFIKNIRENIKEQSQKVTIS